MTPHLNLARFAQMASPGRPPQGYSAPSMPARPPMPRMPAAAGQGRGGDSMVAHMTPGEIAVPPQIQTPDVLTALNRAFASAGANPTSFQAGNPDQKVNPATGMPEFGFFDVALPLALGAAGSMFLGPEVLAPFLVDAGVGASTAGILGGALGGGLGSFAGNAITGKPLDQSLASAAGGAAGSALFGGAMSGFGATPAAEVGPGVGLRDFGGGGAAAGVPDVTAPALTSNAAKSSSGLMDRIFDRVGNMDFKQTVGSALGGQIGSTLAESYFPAKSAPTDLGPAMKPLSEIPPLSSYIGGGSPSSNGPIPYGARRTPPAGYRPGIDPQFSYFRTA